MLYRLGKVLYGLGWLAGAGVAALGVFVFLDQPDAMPMGLKMAFVAAAAVPVGIGWACRYILTGK